MAITAATLMATASCDGSPLPLEHANLDFTTTVEGQEVVLTYEGTHDVMQDENPDIRLLVLVHHDGRLNSVSSFNYVMAALDSAAVDRPELRLRETTLVLSPGMITDGTRLRTRSATLMAITRGGLPGGEGVPTLWFFPPSAISSSSMHSSSMWPTGSRAFGPSCKLAIPPVGSW